ncbi:MAG: membrane-associated protein [Pyrinomonadaceae bacterium]
MEIFNADQIPLWLKLSYTAFVCLLIPVYWAQYGPGNFLWFSDIALLTTVPALWLESSLLTSMMALAVVLFDLAWNVDFFVRLIFGKSVTGLSSYMFDPKISLTIRALSLFHIVFPLLLLWMLSRLGYDEGALVVQTLLSWVILPATYFFSRRSENVNWVFGFGGKPQQWLPPPLYLILLMIMFPLVIYVPTHFLLREIFG